MPYNWLDLTAKNPDLEIADGLLKTWNAYHHGLWRGSISAKKKLKPHSWQTLNIQGAFERFMLLSNDKWDITGMQTVRTWRWKVYETLMTWLATLSQLIARCLQRHKLGLVHPATFGICTQKVCRTDQTHCSNGMAQNSGLYLSHHEWEAITRFKGNLGYLSCYIASVQEAVLAMDGRPGRAELSPEISSQIKSPSMISYSESLKQIPRGRSHAMFLRMCRNYAKVLLAQVTTRIF